MFLLSKSLSKFTPKLNKFIAPDCNTRAYLRGGGVRGFNPPPLPLEIFRLFFEK